MNIFEVKRSNGVTRLTSVPVGVRADNLDMKVDRAKVCDFIGTETTDLYF